MPQTHHKLTTFLVEMANDPHALASFERDPDAAIKTAGLSAHDAEIVKSRDPKKIGAAVTAEFPAGTARRPPITLIITLIW